MKRRRIPDAEAGGTLILAMVVLMMLTLVGLMAIQIVAVEVDVVGAERRADNALYIAEAGIQWGLQTLDGYNFLPGTRDFTALNALPVINGSDSWAPSEIADGTWHELHSGQANIPFGDGAFRVVVKAMAPPNDDTLLVRSFGVSGRPEDGAKRLLEVAVVPGA